MRRVVVTGMGIACPLGLGSSTCGERLINAELGIGAIQAFDTKDLPCKVAGQVPPGSAPTGRPRYRRVDPGQGPEEDGSLHPSRRWSRRPRRWRIPAGRPETEDDRCATGVMIGSGIGGLETIFEASILVHEGRARRLSPFFIPSALINLASGHVSIKYGFKGPNHSVVTACATGVHAIGDAARLIMLGRRRRDGRRRRRGRGVRAGHRRFLCLAARCPPAFNDQPARGFAPLGQGPRRLRHGRGRRRAGAGGVRAREAARCEDLRRDRRLRHVGRRVPHHRAGRGS